MVIRFHKDDIFGKIADSAFSVQSRNFLWILAKTLSLSNPGQERTVAVDGEGCVRGDNVVVADLAVLWRAVLVGRLHLQDAVVDLPLRHRCVVHGLPKRGWKLVHVIHLDVYHCPGRGETAGGDHESEWGGVRGWQGPGQVTYWVRVLVTILNEPWMNSQNQLWECISLCWATTKSTGSVD